MCNSLIKDFFNLHQLGKIITLIMKLIKYAYLRVLFDVQVLVI